MLFVHVLKVSALVSRFVCIPAGGICSHVAAEVLCCFVGLFCALLVSGDGTLHVVFCFGVCNTCQVATASPNTASVILL